MSPSSTSNERTGWDRADRATGEDLFSRREGGPSCPPRDRSGPVGWGGVRQGPGARLGGRVGARAGERFLSTIIVARPDILEWTATIRTSEFSLGSLLLLSALNSYGLLPEDARARIVERLDSDAIIWMQTKVFVDDMYRQIFTRDEFDELTARFRTEWLNDLENLLDELRGRFSSDNEIGLYEDFKDNMEKAESFFFPDGRTAALDIFYAEISAHISSLEDEEPSSESSTWSTQMTTSASISATSVATDSGTIFDDVDE